MKVKVYAKLNLTLNVGEKVGEFHPIDSVATSIDLYDVVEVLQRADREIRVVGMPGVKQECNVAYKAACAFAQAFDACGVDVIIDKRIPFSSGLGGSSADAAAVLYCLCKLQKIDMGCKKLLKICENIGSDVTYMLRGGLGRLRGKGDTVDYFQLKRPVYFALTTFARELTSREVYAAFDRVISKTPRFENADNVALLELLANGMNEQAFEHFSNHLQAAAMSISDYAESYLKFAQVNGLNPVMTGSGSAYFVAFSARDEARKAVNLLNSGGFSTILCQSAPCGIELIEQ